MSGFTPGPWSLGGAYGLLQAEITADNGHRAVAVAWTKQPASDLSRPNANAEWPEGQANARLIAASPCLYEALKAIIDLADRGYPEVNLDAAVAYREAEREAWAKARAAISKAVSQPSEEGK